MIFVFLYMVLMNKSWFLSGMGILQILGSFPIAYMLYFMLGQVGFRV